MLWNVIILLGLALGVHTTDSKSTQLYIYAVAILLATIAQFLLPLPWLRGSTAGCTGSLTSVTRP